MTLSRRKFLGTTAIAAASSMSVGCAGWNVGQRHADKPAFLLMHGAWHGSWAYAQVIPTLAQYGHAAVAIDLPGHGLDARFPRSYLKRPLDRAAFAAEPSPVSEVTLAQCVDHVIRTIGQLHSGGFKRVVLVSHSLSGGVMTRVAEQAPEKLDAMVYLTALMLPVGKTAGDVYSMPQAEGVEIPSLVMADPGAVGASRIDPLSTDPEYLARTKRAFYGDLTDAQFEAVAHLLIPDEPIAIGVDRTQKTVERWGRVKRCYIKCLQDKTIPLALQQWFIDEADQFAPQNPTLVRSLDSSHSPFFSMPNALARTLSEMVSA